MSISSSFHLFSLMETCLHRGCALSLVLKSTSMKKEQNPEGGTGTEICQYESHLWEPACRETSLHTSDLSNHLHHIQNQISYSRQLCFSQTNTVQLIELSETSRNSDLMFSNHFFPSFSVGEKCKAAELE